MENKIKVMAEEKILRLSMPSENGTIVVNNPSQKFKNELINVVVNLITENKNFDEKEIMLDLINHCTNVEFEGNLFESTNLSHEAQMITNEILIIFQEIISEAYQLLQLAMQQTKNEVLQGEILEEKDDIVDVAKKIELKKQKENTRNIEEVPQKVTKKINRGRRCL